jgi:hypothetical protein
MCRESREASWPQSESYINLPSPLIDQKIKDTHFDFFYQVKSRQEKKGGMAGENETFRHRLVSEKVWTACRRGAAVILSGANRNKEFIYYE